MDTSTIISGALLAQVVLGVILFSASSIIEAYQPRAFVFRNEPRPINFGSQLLILVLGSLFILVLTKGQSSLWIGLFKNTSFVGISRDFALPAIFIIDIVIATRIVYATGGSIHSPFQPIFFLIPTLAVLLYESSVRVAFYTFLVAAAFVVLMLQVRSPRLTYKASGRFAYGFVSVSCLALAVAVGLLTRACPEGIC